MTNKNRSEWSDADEFWESIERSAARVRNHPSWMKAGLLVDPTNFVTFLPDEDSSDTKK